MNSPLAIRWVAGGLAALWLALPVAAAVHGTLESHEFCVEHQAFEHVSDSAGSVGFDGDAVAATGASDQHDDCAFDDALLREAPDDGDTACVDVAVTSGAMAPAIEVAFAFDVLANAPKTSPPARLS